MELTILNVAALYYYDEFGLSVWAAGLTAGCFGLLNLFARPLGGVVADRVGLQFGLRGRAMLLAVLLLLGGAVLDDVLSRDDAAVGDPLDARARHVCATWLQGRPSQWRRWSKNAVYSVRYPGSSEAGGNAAAVGFGFLFSADLSTQNVFMAMGAFVIAVSALVFAVRFTRPPGAQKAVQERPLSPTEGEAKPMSGSHPALRAYLDHVHHACLARVEWPTVSGYPRMLSALETGMAVIRPTVPYLRRVEDDRAAWPEEAGAPVRFEPGPFPIRIQTPADLKAASFEEAGPPGDEDRALVRVLDGQRNAKKPCKIAEHIWGAARVADERHPDGWMRSQLRCWSRKAVAMVEGGWRDLVPRCVSDE